MAACDSYPLPVLASGSTYHSAPGGSGTPLSGTITVSQTIYIYTQSGTSPNCAVETSFEVVITTTPATPIVSDVTVCDSYTLPALPAGSTYQDQADGAGNVITGDITSTQLLYVYAQTSNPACFAQASFTVTVNPTPVADAPGDVISCDSYMLPALSVGNYFDAPNGGGVAYFEGDVITSSMTMYVYAQTATTPNCFTENSFTIGIFTSPTIVNPTPLEICDDSADGIACFTLTDKTAEIINNQTGLTVTYHETQQDAEDGVNSYGPVYCNTTAGMQTLYVRVTPATAPQCASITTLVLIVNPKPIVTGNTVADYQLCDVTNPGDLSEGFDLTTLTPGIVGVQTGVTVTYYESQGDAQSGTNPIDTTTPYNNISATQQICARVTNNATGCFTTVCFNLVVNPLPVVLAPAPISACSDGIINEASFDLAANNGAISDFANGVQVTYHLTLADAQNEVGALASPFQSAPTTLFVRVENVDTGCFDTTTIELVVNQGPVATTPSPLTYCDLNNDCIGEFTLTDADLQISGGSLQPGVTITYHETQTDANNGTNPLASPYTNIVQCLQTIYVRVAYDATGCTNFTQLQLIVNPTPVANENTTALEVCDDNADGLACFDLNVATSDVLNGLDASEYTVTYYVLEANAQAGTNAITNLTCFTNTTANQQTIWVRVENNETACFDVVSLDLIVNPLPLVAFPIASYTLCDTTSPGDQVEEFDLDSQIPLIVNNQTGMQVTFHFSATDAEQGINPLASPYTNLATAQTLHVRVENIDTGCFVTSTMDIRVEPLPAPVPPLANDPLLNVCDTNGDGIAEFDLNALIADMQQGGNFSVAFYSTEQDAMTNETVNQLASPYTNTDAYTQIIWVTATNNDAIGCTTILSIVLNVIDSPVIEPTTLEDLRVCDTGSNAQDGIAVFDLTLQNPGLLADQAGPASQYTITYYTTLAGAESGTGRILNPAAYINQTPFAQEIWVRIADANSVCAGIGSFMIYVDAPLVITTPTPLALCDDVAPGPNPTAEFDLTIKDDEITGGNPGYTVAYFVTQADQLANTNAIADPTAYTSLSAAQTLYVAVSGSATGCRSFTTLTIRVLPLPTPRADLSNLGLEACDDSGTATGTATFDLTVNQAFMANGDANLMFTYFTSLEDAMEPINAIADPTAYNGETGTIFIRVNKTPEVDYLGNNCYVIVEQQITVNPLPLVNSPETIPGCDAIGNGTATFDLQLEGNELVLDASLDVADYTFTYHATLADAQSGSAALPNMFTSGPTTIYVRVTTNGTGCSNVGEVELTVLIGATITNPDPAVDPLVACADVGDEDNNSATFDLTVLDAQLLGAVQTAPEFVVDYYATLEDAQDDLPISGYTNYLADTGFVYATVTNTTTGCHSAIIAIPVTVEALGLPVITSVSGGNTICVDFVTDTFLSGQTLQSGYDAGANFDFQWYLDGVEIVGATGADYVIDTIAPGIYTVMMTNNSALACESISVEFPVIKSGPAVIAPANGIGWTVSNAFEDSQDLTINISGFGNYEYSLDYGPFQASNVFTSISAGSHFVTVRDINNTSCGPDLVINDIQAINYPHFFTPNGDGINDTWNIWSLRGDASAKIYIFDRYGKLIKQISPEGTGWNGTFNGQMLPADDYWFKVIYSETNLAQPDPNNPDLNVNDLVKIKEFKAHFSLKR